MVELKSKSAISLLPKGKPRMLPASKSTESLYSISSSKNSVSALYKRKVAAGNSNSNGKSRQTANFIPASNEIKQRVLSARRLRMKTLQNQLSDAQLHIGELANENRILRTLHKRQDHALAKYESTNAELPQLLHSHAEEIRAWQVKCKNLQLQNKELNYKLKHRDSTILILNDENKHLTQLNNDKHLEEREILTERIKILENVTKEKDNELKLLARRLQLESKSFKHQLHSEQSKYKDIRLRLEKTRTELVAPNKLESLEIPDKLAKVCLLPKTLLMPPSITKKNSENKNARTISEESFIKPLNSTMKNFLNNSNRRLSSRSLERNIVKYSNISGRHSKTTDDLTDAIKLGIASLSKSNQFDDTISKDYEDVENDYHPNEYNDVEKTKNDIFETYNDDPFYDDYDGDENDNDVIIASSLSNKTQNDFKSIRKKITDDYQERETFLDAYCRESSFEGLKGDFKHSIDQKKKVSLLAALKAIDENKSKDESI